MYKPQMITKGINDPLCLTLSDADSAQEAGNSFLYMSQTIMEKAEDCWAGLWTMQGANPETADNKTLPQK